MDEVSHWVAQFYVESAARVGLPTDALVSGLPSLERALEKRRGWYDWADHVELLDRLELTAGPETLERLMAASQRSVKSHPSRGALGLFISPTLLFKHGVPLFASTLYRHVQFDVKEQAKDELQVDVRLAPHLRDSALFFRMWSGGFRTVPQALDLPDARVEMVVRPRHGSYRVLLPRAGDVVSRARRGLFALVRSRRAMAELERHQLDLRTAYEGLLSAQREFRSVIDAATDAMLVLHEGRIAYLNEAGDALLGTAGREAGVGRPLLSSVAEEDRERVAGWMAQGASVPRMTFRVVRPDGSLRMVECGPPATITFDQRPSQLIVARDVTPQQRAQEALRRSERRQRALLDAIPDLICSIDRDGTLRDVQGPAQHPLHGPLRDRVGRSVGSLADWDRAPRELLPYLTRDLANAFRGQSGVFEFAFTPDTEPVHIEWRTVAVDAETALCMARDVSSKEKLKMQLVLADRMASLGALAAGAAHEINNPLTYVLGTLEALQTEPAQLSPARLQEGLREAHQGAERIRDIVRDLRCFSRQDNVTPTRIDVNVLVQTSLRMTEPLLRNRARVEVELGSRVVAHTAPSRLSQVMVNLLANAVEALPEEGPGENRIRLLTATEGDGSIRIEVSDNGPGIPRELHSRIFEPFFTTKPAGVGTGLGLSISHRLVRDLGGTLTVKSEVGQGATFVLRLPAPPHAEDGLGAEVSEPARPPHAEAGAREPAVTTDEPGCRYRVLIVDDQARVAVTLKMALEGHEVTVETSGREAIERLSQESFDAVLCDVNMPEMNGREVYEYLQRERPGLERRIVFMTGGVFTAGLQRFLDGIPNPVLEKPFHPERALEVISRLPDVAGSPAATP